MKCTNPWETYLPVCTFQNDLFYTTDPCKCSDIVTNCLLWRQCHSPTLSQHPIITDYHWFSYLGVPTEALCRNNAWILSLFACTVSFHWTIYPIFAIMIHNLNLGNDNSKPCQCNTVCGDFGDCCVDYEEVCNGGGGSDSSCEGRCGEGEDERHVRSWGCWYSDSLILWQIRYCDKLHIVTQ